MTPTTLAPEAHPGAAEAIEAQRRQPWCRGYKVTADTKFQSCANCDHLWFKRYMRKRRHGQTGHHFCTVHQAETGRYQRQPWNCTCPTFRRRVNYRPDGRVMTVVVLANGTEVQL